MQSSHCKTFSVKQEVQKPIGLIKRGKGGCCLDLVALSLDLLLQYHLSQSNW